MTKKILLQGGPDDGKTYTVDFMLVRYTVLRPLAPAKNAVMIGFEKGFYDYNGRKDNDRQVLEWKGWEGERN